MGQYLLLCSMVSSSISSCSTLQNRDGEMLQEVAIGRSQHDLPVSVSTCKCSDLSLSRGPMLLVQRPYSIYLVSSWLPEKAEFSESVNLAEHHAAPGLECREKQASSQGQLLITSSGTLSGSGPDYPDPYTMRPPLFHPCEFLDCLCCLNAFPHLFLFWLHCNRFYCPESLAGRS